MHVQFLTKVLDSAENNFTLKTPFTALESEQLKDNAERQQLSLRLAWAMTIHKCQDLTLEKSWIDLGKSEKVEQF